MKWKEEYGKIVKTATYHSPFCILTLAVWYHRSFPQEVDSVFPLLVSGLAMWLALANGILANITQAKAWKALAYKGLLSQCSWSPWLPCKKIQAIPLDYDTQSLLSSKTAPSQPPDMWDHSLHLQMHEWFQQRSEKLPGWGQPKLPNHRIVSSINNLSHKMLKCFVIPQKLIDAHTLNYENNVKIMEDFRERE